MTSPTVTNKSQVLRRETINRTRMATTSQVNAEVDDESDREGLSDVYSDTCEFPEVSDVESDS